MLVFGGNVIALEQILQRTADILQSKADEILHRFPRIRIPVAQRQEHDRARALLFHCDGIVHDLETLEKLPVFLRALDVEELLRHRQEERLAEAARARDERHVGVAAEERAEERRLVYEIIVVLAELRKEFCPDGDDPIHLKHLLSSQNLCYLQYSTRFVARLVFSTEDERKSITRIGFEEENGA